MSTADWLPPLPLTSRSVTKIMPVCGWLELWLLWGEGDRNSSVAGGPSGCCAGWQRRAGGRPAPALSLHVPDKGLHQLDQRLLALRAGLGEGGGLALGREEDASSRGAGGSPAEVAGEAGEQRALREKKEPDETQQSPPSGWISPTRSTPSSQDPPSLLTSSELSSCFIRCLSRECTAGSLR